MLKKLRKTAVNLTVTLGTISTSFILPIFAQNFPYPPNSTFFTGDTPSLVSADTPDTTIAWPRPHYYFTFNIPGTSPQGVGQISITPENNPESIAFDLQKTSAFQGTSRNRGVAIPLQSVSQDPKTQVITITFANPVPANTTFTLSLQAYNNPSLAATYLFRVQIYPAGQNPIALDLGVGRLSFYQPFR
jgi:hypothetical protein